MESNALLFLAILIFFSKLISDLFSRINLPPVLGMIIIGLIIGPTGFNLITLGEDLQILKFFAEVGVIILLFMAGLETDLEQMKKIGKNALLIALGGVFIPLIFGYVVTLIFYMHDPKVHQIGLMMGLILTATSVSVSVMTLMDMKRLNTVEGNTILGAAIIDDVIGIIMLTFVLGFLGGKSNGQALQGVSILQSIGIIVAFIVGAVLVGVFVIPWLLNLANRLRVEKPVVAIAISILFLYAWVARKAEIAAITGAYLAGVFIGQTRYKQRIDEGFSIIGQAVFVSVFFVYIGLETNLRGHINWLFATCFALAAIVSKIFGAGIVARIVGFDWKRSFRIGSGMVPRGEVALVIATLVSAVSPHVGKNAEVQPRAGMAILSNDHFTAVVFMVIVTAFTAPFLLRLFFREKKNEIEEN